LKADEALIVARFHERLAKQIAENCRTANNPCGMSGWTEQTLRGAASWKAFKEGKSLFEGGAVLDAKAGQSGFQGSVRSGKRPLRVAVSVKSPTDLETRCPCPENQSSGALCAHAVAVGLAALAGKTAKPVGIPPSPAPPPSAPVPWQILLPLNWRDALSRGKFAATLARATGDEISPADDRLNAWLNRENVAPKEILSLNLDGQRVSSFLEALADHPRLAAGKDRLSIAVRSGERFHLDDAILHGNCVRLVPAADSGPWVEIAGAFWRISPETVTRVGEGTIPAELASAMGGISRGQVVEIPTARFFNQLDAWQEWVAFPDGSWLDSLHFVPAAARIELSLEGSLQHLEARLQVKYGEAPAVSPGLGKVDGLPRLIGDRCEVRNSAAEERAVNRITRAGFQPEDYSSGRWMLNGESAILDFLTRSLPDLRNDWTVTEGERFGHVQKQVTVVSPKIDILGSGEDWLSFDLSFQTSDGVSIPAAEVRRLLRSGRSSGQASGGRHLVISNEVSEIIDPLFSELDLQQENGRFTASARSGELIREIRNKLRNTQTENVRSKIEEFQSPASFSADLRPYQRHGAAWLCDRVERFGGALLADDMGLGKTIQTIALIEHLFLSETDDSGVVLVLATASLLGNWKAEFRKFAPGRTVRILHGASRDAERGRVQAGEVVLTSYGTLARDSGVAPQTGISGDRGG
jgi:hypothetical protein